MPVAALIVVGPGIEVKSVKRDSLRADWDHVQERTNVAIEAILSMPRYEGASRMRMKRGTNRGGVGKRLICSESECASKESSFIDDLDEPVVPAVQGQVAT